MQKVVPGFERLQSLPIAPLPVEEPNLDFDFYSDAGTVVENLGEFIEPDQFGLVETF